MHDSSYLLLPTQGKPPHEGAGLLHDLVSIFIPLPHVLLHDPSVHELHPPSTTEKLRLKIVAVIKTHDVVSNEAKKKQALHDE